MTVFALTDELIFPDPELANDDGLLAIGGDLSEERLILAYRNGIFPWYNQYSPILWWALNPRMVLFPENFKVSKSLNRLIKKGAFTIKTDTNFEAVINHCAEVPRRDDVGTWITSEMKRAYINLFKKGYAHSVETYLEQKLVGGLYGVSLGKIFFGESMFHLVNDASKIALFFLVEKLKSLNYKLIDAQMETQLIRNLGGELINFAAYRNILNNSISDHNIKLNWNL